jgi:hypothetical protein
MCLSILRLLSSYLFYPFLLSIFYKKEGEYFGGGGEIFSIESFLKNDFIK